MARLAFALALALALAACSNITRSTGRFRCNACYAPALALGDSLDLECRLGCSAVCEGTTCQIEDIHGGKRITPTSTGALTLVVEYDKKTRFGPIHIVTPDHLSLVCTMRGPGRAWEPCTPDSIPAGHDVRVRLFITGEGHHLPNAKALVAADPLGWGCGISPGGSAGEPGQTCTFHATPGGTYNFGVRRDDLTAQLKLTVASPSP